jgi:hypothetical protein
MRFIAEQIGICFAGQREQAPSPRGLRAPEESYASPPIFFLAFRGTATGVTTTHPVNTPISEEPSMSSIDALQRRLDTYFQRATDNVNNAAINAAESQSLDDMHSFFTSMNGMSVAVNAATQQTTAHHNLAKAIIDAMP